MVYSFGFVAGGRLIVVAAEGIGRVRSSSGC
jgi:hypothetical protein